MRVFSSLVVSGSYHRSGRAALSIKPQKGLRRHGNYNNTNNGVDGSQLPVKKPDGLPSLTPSKLTEKQWQESIAEAAAKAAKATGKDGKYDDKAVAELRKKYVATVSPDRINIINNAVLSGNANGMYYDGDTPVAYYGKDGWHAVSTPAETARGKAFDAAFEKSYKDALEAIKKEEDAKPTLPIAPPVSEDSAAPPPKSFDSKA